MRIGILGTGNMAEAFGGQWSRHGHRITIGGRDVAKATALAASIRASAGTVAEAASVGTVAEAGLAGAATEAALAEAMSAGAAGEAGLVGTVSEAMSAGSVVGAALAGVVAEAVSAGTVARAASASDVLLLAVPHAAVPAVLAAAGSLRGKVIIDCTNPLVPGQPTLATSGRSAAELIADLAPGAHVVKAFNLCHVDVWRMTPPVFAGRPLAVPLCGDDADAIDTVASLVDDLGCRPIRAGGLERAGLMEATAAFMIGLWFGGHDAQAIFPPL